VRHNANTGRVDIDQNMIESGQLGLQETQQAIEILRKLTDSQINFLDTSFAVMQEVKIRDRTS
jgi:hypothetical protein